MKQKLVFLTGAGMSAESGISTFRDSGGLWEQYPVEAVASIDGYRRDPALVQQFYNERRAQLAAVQPNEGHRLVASLEDRYDCTVITQNVDDLHERAGSTHIIHLHGELLKATSSDNPNDPRCIITLPPHNLEIKMGDRAADGSQLRPFIVWFGEPVPAIDVALDYVEKADILVIIGTSLNVYPAAGLIQYTRPGCQIYLIDPNDVHVPGFVSLTHIQKGASEGMKDLCATLSAQ